MDPENANTMHLTGVVCSEAKQFDHAVEWTSRAIRKHAKPTYLTTLGIALARDVSSVHAEVIPGTTSR